MNHDLSVECAFARTQLDGKPESGECSKDARRTSGRFSKPRAKTFLFAVPLRSSLEILETVWHASSPWPTASQPFLKMIVGEYFYARRCNADTTKMLFGYNIPTWLWGAYEKIGIFGFGAASTVLITDIAKYTIGRLRPHFMTLCVPNVNCNLPENQHRYIENYSCTSNISRRLLKEIR
ncbi:hypothetical protein K0M31_000082 [Melipona bicolor]|uniref:Uncharacterized protein n=1 Tax=Melipona bicolor TaxID=60889 RepID=A0AA40GCS8_9HYME|nr:hypothetical protein K0M31_000082 [Melipona bicolor]